MTPDIFSPVDPATVSTAYLKQRTGLLFAAMESGRMPDLPLAAGWYRCFVCRREFEKTVPDDEALAEYQRRFGPGRSPEDMLIICDDCNRIVSEDQGVLLLCQS